MATITSPRTASPAPSSTNTPRMPPSSSASSSARNSLDLNRASTPNQPGTPNTANRRNRAALRDYYNLKSKPTGTAQPATGNLQRTDSVTSIQSDASIATTTTLINERATTSALTAQLDSPSFNAEEWLDNLLQKSSLRDILKTEATLVSEIRNLDGERKALVYDNYSKLIKAVGTIGAMQRSMNGSTTTTTTTTTTDAMREMSVQILGGDRDVKRGLEGVEELEGRMEGLRVTVRELAGDRDGVAKKNEEERKANREKRNVDRRKRNVVKWVLDAPERLRSLVEKDQKVEAEKEWSMVKRYLDKWKDVKGVNGVRMACEDVMVDNAEDEK